MLLQWGQDLPQDQDLPVDKEIKENHILFMCHHIWLASIS